MLVLDRLLALVAHISAPISDGRFDATISMDGSLAAFASLDHTVVTAVDGTIRWQRKSVIKSQGLPRAPLCTSTGPGVC